jgi:hypothetical protein
MAEEVKGARWEEFVFINPAGVQKAAETAGVSYSKALKATIRHERLHQGIRLAGLEEEVAEAVASVSIPSSWSKDLIKRYSKSAAGFREEMVGEEFLAHSLGDIYLKESPQVYQQATKVAKELEQMTNIAVTQEISAHQMARQAQRKIKMQAVHRQAQVQSSVNAMNPGSRHRQKTGKIVQ